MCWPGGRLRKIDVEGCMPDGCCGMCGRCWILICEICGRFGVNLGFTSAVDLQTVCQYRRVAKLLAHDLSIYRALSLKWVHIGKDVLHVSACRIYLPACRRHNMFRNGHVWCIYRPYCCVAQKNPMSWGTFSERRHTLIELRAVCLYHAEQIAFSRDMGGGETESSSFNNTIQYTCHTWSQTLTLNSCQVAPRKSVRSSCRK